MTTGNISVARNIAVFIDAENLFKGYGKKREFPEIPMAEVLRLVEEAAAAEAGAGTIGMAKAYADWTRDGMEGFLREVQEARIEPDQAFPPGVRTKNAADIKLVVDALRTASNEEQLEVFVIVSGDGDFIPLVTRLRQLGRYVVSATIEGLGASELLRKNADLYVKLPATSTSAPSEAPSDDTVPSDDTAPSRTPRKRTRRGRGSTAKEESQQPAAKDGPAKDTAKKDAAKKDTAKKDTAKKSSAKKDTAKKSPAKKTPAKKDTAKKETAAKSSAPPDWGTLAEAIGEVHSGPAGSAEEYRSVIRSLLETPKFKSYCDKLVNHGGTLPRLALAIRVAAPGLSPSDAGVRNLSRALRFALAGTRFALAQGPDDPQPLLVRRSKKPPNMLPDLSLEEIGGS